MSVRCCSATWPRTKAKVHKGEGCPQSLSLADIISPVLYGGISSTRYKGNRRSDYHHALSLISQCPEGFLVQPKLKEKKKG